MVGEEKFKLSHRVQTIGQQQPRNSEQLSLLRRQLCLECCLLKWDEKKNKCWLHELAALFCHPLSPGLKIRSTCTVFLVRNTKCSTHVYWTTLPSTDLPMISKQFNMSTYILVWRTFQTRFDGVWIWGGKDLINPMVFMASRYVSFRTTNEMHFQSLPGSAQASSLTQQNSTQQQKQQKTTNKFIQYYHFVQVWQVLPIKITINS